MQEVDYSVVIPAHNAAGTIRKCLESVLNQTQKASRVIVVCDDCTDNTIEIVESYFETNVVAMSVNFHSSAKSRNFGVNFAESEYIAFLDADDIWMPAKIEKQLPFLVNSKVSTLVATDSIFINSYGTIVGRNIRTQTDDEATSMLWSGFAMPALLSTWLFPRETFQRLGGFDVNLPMSEDFDFANRAVRSGTGFAMVREPLSLYLLHSSSKTALHKVMQQRVANYVRDRSSTTYDLNIEDYLTRKIGLKDKRDAVVDIQIRRFLITAKPSKFQRNYLRLLLAFLLNPRKMITKFSAQRI